MSRQDAKKTAPGRRTTAAVARRSDVRTPFDRLGDRRRKKTFLLRVNDDELRMIQELAVIHGMSRSNALRMMVKQAHAAVVERPLRAQAETDVAREAARLAVNERVEELREEILSGIRSHASRESRTPSKRERGGS